MQNNLVVLMITCLAAGQQSWVDVDIYLPFSGGHLFTLLPVLLCLMDASALAAMCSSGIWAA